MPFLTAGAPFARSAMAYVLAGGKGSRLLELTDWRAKPAVYFGGKSRIVDFALSNALNSGIRRIGVATQYKAHSLIRHLQRGWNFFRLERNESFDILPASQRVTDEAWYAGTADAVYQNIDIIESYAPKYIVILAGDHIYKMDYEPMLVQHVEQNADVTVGCLEVTVQEASAFGVMHVDDNNYIRSFVEKPKDPPTMPGKPTMALASMGIYVFDTVVPVPAASPRRRRPAFEPRLRQGHHPLHREARQRGGAPFLAVMRAHQRPGGLLLARRRNARRLLGGQHGLDRHRAAARSLRPQLADLDLCRNLAAGEIRARPGWAPRPGGIIADLRRLHHFRRLGPPVAAVHQRPSALLLGGGERGRAARGPWWAAASASRT